MKNKGMLKTVLITLLVAGFFVLPLSSALAQGQKPSDFGYGDLPEGPQKGGAFLDTIDVITDWIFAVLMLIAVIYLVMGAYQFITGGGDPAKVNEARQKLLYAVIGIGLALAANGVDNVLGNIIG